MPEEKMNRGQDLLFEIGVEEIPSGYFAHAVKSILTKAPELLKECAAVYDELIVHTTPRRIVIAAKNFKIQRLGLEERLGPSKEQAYQNGEPTQALLGFLKSAQAKPSDAFFKETPKGLRVGVKVKKDRKPLRHFFETLPRMIEFPKLMRWEKTKYHFTRPIRWTFAFVGTQLQVYTIAGVTSSHFTYGHRFLSKGKIRVISADFEDYRSLLKRHHVILDSGERAALVRQSLKPVRNHDEELVQTVAHLTEEPYAVKGKFDKAFLDLPSEVLSTCMKKGQKTFACYDASGKLVNQFVAVINGKRKDLGTITRHYEQVLVSRLKDAQFFFEEDRKTALASKIEKLKDTVFLGSLGSYYDRTKRLERQTAFLGHLAGLPAETVNRAKEAASLCKADLAAHLVYEFPELQGIAGEQYARLEGKHPKVCGAIRQHYLPGNLTQTHAELKSMLSEEGALLGLCDKMDLLVGAFSLGIKPDSSQDPYALRRTGGGIVKILRAFPFRFSLHQWVQEAKEAYGKLLSKSNTDVEAVLTPFLMERLAYELQAKAGTRERELLDGILKSGCDDIAGIYIKYEQLTKTLGRDEFEHARKVMERTSNILKGVKEKPAGQVEQALLENDLERKLYQLLSSESQKISELARAERYQEATRLYGETFYKPLHDFFDKVMVNADDLKVRSNRQALMKGIHQLYARHIADLALVQPLT